MENKNIVKSPGNDLSQASGLGAEQIELIKNTVARGATNDELKLFLIVAKRTGLDPFSKQIHFVKRKVWNARKNGYEEVGSIQTGIDGYRAIAERTGTLAGIDDAVFDDEITLHPEKASVTVYRFISWQRVGFTASARWSEYAALNQSGEPQSMWKKMPYLMLGKCAEALALRKAFPNDLSGLYTNEEMQQAGNQSAIPVHVDATPVREATSVGDGSPAEEGEPTVPTTNENEAPVLLCKDGDEIISQAEHDYSVKNFGRPLCREHQKEARERGT